MKGHVSRNPHQLEELSLRGPMGRQTCQASCHLLDEEKESGELHLARGLSHEKNGRPTGGEPVSAGSGRAGGMTAVGLGGAGGKRLRLGGARAGG